MNLSNKNSFWLSHQSISFWYSKTGCRVKSTLWRDILNMGSSRYQIRGRYLNKWRGAGAEIPYTLDSTPLVLWHTVLRRQLNKNGKHIQPHCQQGGAQRLHEALHRGQCRLYHGALGLCKVQSPKIFFLRIPPSNMTAQVSRSMMEYGRLLQ